MRPFSAAAVIALSTVLVYLGQATSRSDGASEVGKSKEDIALANNQDEGEKISTIRRLLRDNSDGSLGPPNIRGNLSDWLHGAKGQPLVIDHLLGEKRNGFYVEAGAADGLRITNTLFFEVNRNWTGLLVEANPLFYEQLCKTNRRATSINCCLGSGGADKIDFVVDGLFGSISDPAARSRGVKGEVITVDCLPLADILEAMNRTRIDLLSLDIEGAEFPVLKSLPFHKLDVGILLVELANVDSVKDVTLDDFFKLLDEEGFDYLGTVAKDAIFGNRRWALQVPTSRNATETPADILQRELFLKVRGFMRRRINQTLKRLKHKNNIHDRKM